MADADSSYTDLANAVKAEPCVLTAIALAKAAVEQADTAYELILELENLLAALGEPDQPPKWVFSLYRMAERACRAADVAHTAAVNVRLQLERSGAA